eukprot:8474498-Alexandrium_andersonii.AAC.1
MGHAARAGLLALACVGEVRRECRACALDRGVGVDHVQHRAHACDQERGWDDANHVSSHGEVVDRHALAQDRPARAKDPGADLSGVGFAR